MLKVTNFSYKPHAKYIALIYVKAKNKCNHSRTVYAIIHERLDCEDFSGGLSGQFEYKVLSVNISRNV